MTEENLPSELKVGYQRPDRNLALELVRVTEAAALAARPMGRPRGQDRGRRRRGRGDAHDDLTVTMNGVVVIGEGEKDQAPDALQRRARR